MRRRKARSTYYEPSLVPMADMLTNTVGIIVFILIFTVLAAGGVVVTKRLPREHTTQAAPVYFLCVGGRIFPLDAENLVRQFIEPLGKPRSYYEVDVWIKKFNARRVEDEYLTATGEGEIHRIDLGFYKSAYLDLAMTFTPKDGKGESLEEFKQENSQFRRFLQAHNTQDNFVHFFVRPDSLEIFTAARALAIEQMNYSTGWRPLDQETALRFALTGSGRTALPQ